jgi:FkbM family methyltransferase
MSRSARVGSGEALRIAVSDPKRAGRKILREVRKLIDPSNIRRVRRDIGLPLRNAVLHSKPIKVNLAGQRLRLVPEGAIAAGLWSGADFEAAELALISRLLRSDSVFVDIGANVGIFSLVASKVCFAGRILALEPTTKTFEWLSRNISLNDARNIMPFRLAVGNFTGKATLSVNVSGKDGLNTLGKPSHPDSNVAGSEIVPITTLDDFLRSVGVYRVDIMKVDAEGAELFIFQGAKDLLERSDAPLILYEAFPSTTQGFDYHPVELFWLLDQWGFSLFTLDSETGKLAVPPASRAYGSMMVAVKPSHSCFHAVQDLSR